MRDEDLRQIFCPNFRGEGCYYTKTLRVTRGVAMYFLTRGKFSYTFYRMSVDIEVQNWNTDRPSKLKEWALSFLQYTAFRYLTTCTPKEVSFFLAISLSSRTAERTHQNEAHSKFHLSTEDEWLLKYEQTMNRKITNNNPIRSKRKFRRRDVLLFIYWKMRVLGKGMGYGSFNRFHAPVRSHGQYTLPSLFSLFLALYESAWTSTFDQFLQLFDPFNKTPNLRYTRYNF